MIAKVVLYFEPTKGFSVFCLFTCIIGEFFVDAGVRPQSKVAPSGVRPQSKVASDCTLAPDPRSAGSASGRGGRRLTQKKKTADFVCGLCFVSVFD